MTKSAKKDFFREIRGSMGRFLSILFISLLGVAFFAGIRSTSPDMKLTADATYDSANLMDIQVLGTLGVTESDLASILHIDGVKYAEASYQKDLICVEEGRELVVKAISMPDKINKITITDGRTPQADNECVVDHEFLKKTGYEIGDTIELKTGDDSDLEDSVVTNNYKIVGTATSAMYLNSNRGTSDIGDGNVTSFIILPKTSFTMDAFAALYVTVEGAGEMNSYSKDYQEKIDKVIDGIKTLESERCKIRYVEVKQSSAELLEKANADYEKGKAEAQQKLDDAYNQLKAANQQIVDGRNQIAEKEELLVKAQESLQANEESLNQAKIYIEAGKLDLENGKTDYEKNMKTLADWKTKLAARQEELKKLTNKDDITAKKTEIAVLQTAVNEMEKTLADAKVQIEQAEKQIPEYEAQIAIADEKIKAGYQEIADATVQVEQAKTKLEEAELELEYGKQDYSYAREDAEEELADAEKKLVNAQDFINNLEEPEWYVLDRSSVSSCLSFKEDTRSIESIANIFPVFFFLIAALVALTTMTRMVEEERIQIGTLKALGYSKQSIVIKYLAYAFFASGIGSIIGFLIGEKVCPYVVLRAYSSTYYALGKTVMPFNAKYAIISTLVAVLCICLATFLACYKELMSVPAELMRPEAPKNGKRIFLEKVKFLWAKLNFTQKAALRNLFRYKKRFFMTVFGVGGCMALLLVAFGIGDSVDAMSKKQYEDIFNYNMTVGFESDIDRAGRRSVMSDMKFLGDVKEELQVYKSMHYFEANEKDYSGYFVVPENVETFANYVKLQKRSTGEKYSLDGTGVVISEKLAELLNVKVGDNIVIKTSENSSEKKTVPIAAITENYVYHYVYMSPELYQNVFNASVPYNAMLVKTQTLDETELSAQLLAINGVTTISTVSSDKQSVENMISSLNSIVLILIVSAALLAFIVLYNLNNININERRRELATIKLLGFYNKELSMYVYRENIILTIFGVLVGVVVGIFLHRYIMQTAESDLVMLGRELSWLSFVLSIVLTAVFAAVVNAFMSIKLKKIDMVESLKSVE